VAEIGNVGKMKEERIYVSENKLEHFVTRLRIGIDFTPSEVRKQTL